MTTLLTIVYWYTLICVIAFSLFVVLGAIAHVLHDDLERLGHRIGGRDVDLSAMFDEAEL